MNSRRWLYLTVAVAVFALAATCLGVSAPQELTVISAGDHVNLSWQAVPGAESYNIYKDIVPEVDLSFPYATATTTTYFRPD